MDSSKNNSLIGQKKLLFSYFQFTNIPLAVMTDLIRSGMDNIKFARVGLRAFPSEAKFCGVFLHLSFSSRIDQRFSIGFRSGELAGQTPFPMTVMLWHQGCIFWHQFDFFPPPFILRFDFPSLFSSTFGAQSPFKCGVFARPVGPSH